MRLRAKEDSWLGFGVVYSVCVCAEVETVASGSSLVERFWRSGGRAGVRTVYVLFKE